MKRTVQSRGRRLLPLFLLLILVFSFPAGARAIKETDSGLFYSITAEGEAVIEGFNAAGTVMTVPSEIEGAPVRRIADQACRGCEAITEVRLPDTLTEIGEYAFADCPNLLRVTMAGGETIAPEAFSDCKALLSVILPDTLTAIGDEAFRGCHLLGRITIPASVTEIGVDAFAGCDRVRFDAKENEYAISYAKANGIPTSFVGTWGFTLLMIGVVTLLLGGAILLGKHLLKTKKKSARA